MSTVAQGKAAELAERFGVQPDDIARRVDAMRVLVTNDTEARAYLVGVAITTMELLAEEHGDCHDTGCKLCRHERWWLSSLLAARELSAGRKRPAADVDLHGADMHPQPGDTAPPVPAGVEGTALGTRTGEHPVVPAADVPVRYEEVLFERPAGCDSPNPPSIYRNADGTITCRCLVCGRCGHHTGNTSQGHYWAFCKVTKQMEAFHFCCPDDCELQATTAPARLDEPIGEVTPEDGHHFECCGKVGRISPHALGCPAYAAMLARDNAAAPEQPANGCDCGHPIYQHDEDGYCRWLGGARRCGCGPTPEQVAAAALTPDAPTLPGGCVELAAMRAAGVPRVFTAGDPEPDDVRWLADSDEDIWERDGTAWRHSTMIRDYSGLVRDWGPLTEVKDAFERSDKTLSTGIRRLEVAGPLGAVTMYLGDAGRYAALLRAPVGGEITTHTQRGRDLFAQWQAAGGTARAAYDLLEQAYRELLSDQRDEVRP